MQVVDIEGELLEASDEREELREIQHQDSEQQLLELTAELLTASSWQQIFTPKHAFTSGMRAIQKH